MQGGELLLKIKQTYLQFDFFSLYGGLVFLLKSLCVWKSFIPKIPKFPVLDKFKIVSYVVMVAC